MILLPRNPIKNPGGVQGLGRESPQAYADAELASGFGDATGAVLKISGAGANWVNAEVEAEKEEVYVDIKLGMSEANRALNQPMVEEQELKDMNIPIMAGDEGQGSLPMFRYRDAMWAKMSQDIQSEAYTGLSWGNAQGRVEDDVRLLNETYVNKIVTKNLGERQSFNQSRQKNTNQKRIISTGPEEGELESTREALMKSSAAMLANGDIEPGPALEQLNLELSDLSFHVATQTANDESLSDEVRLNHLDEWQKRIEEDEHDMNAKDLLSFSAVNRRVRNDIEKEQEKDKVHKLSAEGAQLNIESQGWTDDPAQQVDYIKAKYGDNPTPDQQRIIDNAVARSKADFVAKNSFDAAEMDDTIAQGWAEMRKNPGMDAIPADPNLPTAVRASMEAWAMRGGPPPVDNTATVNELNNMAMYDKSKFIALNLGNYQGMMTDGTWNRFTAQQAAIIKDAKAGYTSTITSAGVDINSKIKSIGLKPDSPRAQLIRSLVSQKIHEMQSQLGGITPEQEMDIINDAFKTSKDAGANWSDINPFADEAQLTLKDVDIEDLRAANNNFKYFGLPVNAATVNHYGPYMGPLADAFRTQPLMATDPARALRIVDHLRENEKVVTKESLLEADRLLREAGK